MNVTFTSFGGIVPRLADHQLGYSAATQAHDVKLRNGRLEPWLKNCHFADAVEDAKSFHIYGCCPVTWDTIVTAGNLPPDWKRFYIAGRDGNGLEAVELACECEPTYYTGGVPAPTEAPEVEADEECSREADARSYVYTYLNKWGEESRPSPASDVIRVDDGTEVEVTNIVYPPDGYGITHAILYRSSTGFRVMDGKVQEFATAYLYVDTIEFEFDDDDEEEEDTTDTSTDTDDEEEEAEETETTSYTDTMLSIYLGPALETQDDRMPPLMSGVLAVRDQIRLVGWRKNRIYMSENLMPHNWPAVYDLTLDHSIIHVGELDQRLFVTTDAYPYIIDISNCDVTKPAPVTSIETALPDIGCQRANGAVMTAHGLFYASPIGIILLSPDGSWDVITARWFGEEEWRNLMPDTITMAYYEGYLFFSTEMATFLLDINARPYGNAENAELVTLSDKPIACMTSNTGALILLQDDELLVWGGGDEPREYTWRSRPITGGTGGVGRNNPDAQMTVSRVSETYSARGPLWSPASLKLGGAANVRLSTPHGRDVVNRFVGTEKPLRLARSGRHLFYWLEITGHDVVEFINMGTATTTVNGGS